MLARIHVAPNDEDVVTDLQIIADTLFALNVVWLRRVLARGLVPPSSALQCAPSWCTAPIVCVEHHGDEPISTERDYYDGPMLFHRGTATCIDIASYDAAASTVLHSRPARPLVVGQLPRLHCVVRYDAGDTYDPTLEM